MYIGLHVKYRYSCQILMEFEFYQQIFEKYWNIKFHENPTGGSRVGSMPDGRTDKWAYKTELSVNFVGCFNKAKIFLKTNSRSDTYN